MDKKLDERIPEVIEGAKQLLDPDFNLFSAIETYMNYLNVCYK